MNFWFIDDKSVWSIPDSELPRVISLLREAQADVLADTIEVCLETGADELGMDDKEQPDLRAAVEGWASDKEDVPEWALQVIGEK